MDNRESIAVGLDIGTTKIVAMIGKKNEYGKLEILGIGKAKSVVPDFNQNAFTQIDYTSTKTISINKKGAKLVSTHPSGTYKLQTENEKVTSIEITDPENFWKASKYLVVVAE